MGAYQPEGIKPIALVGENVHLMPQNKYYTVERMETLPPFIVDFGSLTAGKTKEKERIEDTEMPKTWLAQYRFKPLDDIEIKVYQPEGKGKYLIKKDEVMVSVNIFIREIDPCLHLTELFQWEDTRLLFTVTNPTKYDLPTSRVLFFGIRYKLKEIPKPPRFTTVFTKGVG